MSSIDMHDNNEVQLDTNLQRSAFDEISYLLNYPDVLELGVDPLEHFERFGSNEGRLGHPADASAFLTGILLKGYRQLLFDAEWYADYYPDIKDSALTPYEHFCRFGEAEYRCPCRFFDPTWYRARYADVRASNLMPFDHYILWGAEEGRNPSEMFDAAFYISRHPTAARNALIHYKYIGQANNYPSRREFFIDHYLPSTSTREVVVDLKPVSVIIPVYKGLIETKRCVDSLLSDPDRAGYDVIIIDDCSPEPDLSAYVATLRLMDGFRVFRNTENLGFVKTINRGIALAGRNDVTLLNSDTRVPGGWMSRLQAHAYDGPPAGSVSPVSNNATICGYPVIGANDIPFGVDLSDVDRAMAEANAGRWVSAPTTVGFCMYVRRNVLDEVGILDADTFGLGYGEEVDFCQRASMLGYIHKIAWDVYVYHVGEVSFGTVSPSRVKSVDLLRQKYPSYDRSVDLFVRYDEALPYRFAATAALFAKNSRETKLIVTHHLGGGVKRHIEALARDTATTLNLIVVSSSHQKFTIWFPQDLRHPTLDFNYDQLPELVMYLRSAALASISVHHTLGIAKRLMELLLLLRPITYEMVIHDFFYICPQITLTQWYGDIYCGEPEARVCNACIGAKRETSLPDIDFWRLSNFGVIQGASRVVFPSVDAADRLKRYFDLTNVSVVPHDHWPKRDEVHIPALYDGVPMRVAILGVLARHKGASFAIELADIASDYALSIHLIGYFDDEQMASLAGNMHVTGPYEPSMIAQMIAEVDPHIIWFPARWPETYSYTLSEAFAAHRAVLAPNIGAFKERLEGRPLSWLYPIQDDACQTADRLLLIRRQMEARRPTTSFGPRSRSVSIVNTGGEVLPTPRVSRVGREERPLRRALIIPELFDHGVPTPCGYIRQILPYLSIKDDLRLSLSVGSTMSIASIDPDILLLQRHSVTDLEVAQAIRDWGRRRGARIVYDLDDDLINIPTSHPEAKKLLALAEVVRFWVSEADIVTVSTNPLADEVVKYRPMTCLLPNALDERLWLARAPRAKLPSKRVGILYMGTATHSAEMEFLKPVLEKIVGRHGDRVDVTVIGITEDHLPAYVRRVASDGRLSHSYPGFVDWLTENNVWDIGLAPLASAAFNRSKSDIKTMDYAALGLCSIASRVEAYTGSIADGVGGALCDNDERSWFEIIDMLIRDYNTRAEFQQQGYKHLIENNTLSAQKSQRIKALLSI